MEVPTCADSPPVTTLVPSAYDRGALFLPPVAHDKPSFRTRLQHGKPLTCYIRIDLQSYEECPLHVAASWHSFHSLRLALPWRRIAFHTGADANVRMVSDLECVSSETGPGKVSVIHMYSLPPYRTRSSYLPFRGSYNEPSSRHSKVEVPLGASNEPFISFITPSSGSPFLWRILLMQMRSITP